MSDAVPGVAELQERLGRQQYLADDGLATALFLAARLPQPLLLEGEAGVGKSELARALAGALGAPWTCRSSPALPRRWPGPGRSRPWATTA